MTFKKLKKEEIFFHPSSFGSGEQVFPTYHSFAKDYIDAKIGAHEDFEWNKDFYESGSFDDLNFRFKNKVYSVLLKIRYNGDLIIDTETEKKLPAIARKNNLIPCVFPIEVTEKAGIYSMCCEAEDNQFNLFNLITGKNINPETEASDTLVPMSHYDLHNKSIRTIVDEMISHGYDVCEFWDNPTEPEDFPKIWFFDKNDYLCWVVVKYGRDRNIKFPNLKKMFKKLPITYETTGYFAPVAFEDEDKILYRNTSPKISILQDIMVKVHDIDTKQAHFTKVSEMAPFYTNY